MHHRLQQNIKHKDLADRAGINRTTLSDLELGRKVHEQYPARIDKCFKDEEASR